jgi:hypothetical protein
MAPMEGWVQKWMSWGFLTTSILIHIGFILSLLTGTLNFLFYDTKYIVGQGADFFSYYQAGHNVLNGLDCYTVPDTLVVPYFYLYRYLPYFAYSFGVIVNLAPPLLAYCLWVSVVLGSMWLAIIRTQTVAKVLHRSDWEVRLAMGMWFVFTPIYIELFVGQVTLFAAILMFFALTTPSFVNGQKSRWGTMTASWIVGSLTKLIPFFIAPVLLGAGRVRQVLVAVMVTLLAILAVPAGLESLQFFLDFNFSRTFFIAPYVGSHSLKMLLFYLLGEPGSDFFIVTVLLACIFFILAIGATFYSRDVWACAGLFCLTYFFIMTDVWEHHYTFILPLLVLAWIRGRPDDKSRWVPFALVILMSIPMMPIIEFLAGFGPGVHPITWGPIWQIVYHSSKVVPALIFYGWLLIIAVRTQREDSILRSVANTFRNAWDGLIKGYNPSLEAGILLQTEHDVSSQT